MLLRCLSRAHFSNPQLGTSILPNKVLIRWKSSLATIRNIGIIAHIDAGKTTTTERLLYYSGKITRMGDVDSGDTITDFLPQERERGITIQSAAISFPWGDDCNINLIDTPGHADFCFEVIRTLKILDGCVTILDGVAGVEAQTEKVWKLSHFLPKICFVNKMDRIGANFNNSVKNIAIKLHTRPIIINFPIFDFISSSKQDDPKIIGVVDIINQTVLKWEKSTTSDRNDITVQPIDPTSPYFQDFIKCRESLIDTLTEFDEDLLSEYIDKADGDCLKITQQRLNQSIRSATISRKVTPVLAGSAFKNVGVQPVLDAIRDYLPSPIEARIPDLLNNNNNKSHVPAKIDSKMGLIINNNKDISMALAFKVITDPIRGIMVFVRVYSGTLRNGYTVYNSTRGTKPFRIGKLVKMDADQPVEVDHLSLGEIGVLLGASISDNITTGETIISHSCKRDGIKSLKNKNNGLAIQINPIKIPPPVFSVVIEPQTLGNTDHMEACLQTLITEDPSLHLSKDNETGQTILSGMGELHLEIASDKLINDMDAKINLGKITVSYKESLDQATAWEGTDPSLQPRGFHFTVRVEPLQENQVLSPKDDEYIIPLRNDNNYVIIEKNSEFDPSLEEWKPVLPFESIVNAIISSSLVILQRGGKINNLPLFGCVVRIKGDWRIPLDIDKPTEILNIVRSLIQNSLRKSPKENYILLEPIMDLDVTLDTKDIGKVSQDLTSARNATILSIEDADMSNDSMREALEFTQYAETLYLPKCESTTTNSGINTDSNQHSSIKIIKAEVPLQNMIAYNRTFRSLTQGRGDFYMEYNSMKKMNQTRMNDILKDI